MLRPDQLHADDTVTVEFIDTYAKTDDPDPASYDWHVDEIEIVTEEVEVEPDEDDEDAEPEVEEQKVEAIVDLTWVGDETDDGKRIVFDYETGRWRIERRREDDVWFRWNVEEQCDVRFVEDDDEE